MLKFSIFVICEHIDITFFQDILVVVFSEEWTEVLSHPFFCHRCISAA